jgi:hypothetical protein
MIEIYVDISVDSPIYEQVQQILLKAVQKVEKREKERDRRKADISFYLA